MGNLVVMITNLTQPDNITDELPFFSKNIIKNI